MENIHVLLVDDDPAITMVMGYALSSIDKDIATSTVDSASACLDYLSGGLTVDCIVSDFQMPVMDGIQLLRRLRGSGNHVPFIFFTAQGNEEVARDAFREGANDYFTKEAGVAHYDRLVNSIRQAVSRRQAHEAKLVAEKEWEETFNAIDDLVTLHGPDFVIRRGNRAAEKALCPGDGGLRGKKCYELFHHADAPAYNCPALQLTSGESGVCTHTVDVQGRPFEVKVCPIIEDGRLKSFVHIAKPVNGKE